MGCEDRPVTSPSVPPALPASPLVLVTGATGYIGGRLVPELLAAGFRVRVMARGHGTWPTASGTTRSRSSRATRRPRRVAEAMSRRGRRLLPFHALGTGRDFESTRPAAPRRSSPSRRACRGRPDRLPRRPVSRGRGAASPHLESRKEVGRDPAGQSPCRRPCCAPPSSSVRDRRRSRCCATSPSGCRSWSRRAGSTPGSSRSRSATSCATWWGPPPCQRGLNRGFDIGGPDVLTYREMMQRYAAVPG